MVQILPRPYASSGERLEEGFSRGLQQGAGFAQNILGHKLEEKAKIADIERKQKFAEQIYNNPDLQGLPEITRRLLANEAAGLQSAQATKSTLNLLREQEGRSRLADALGISQEEGAPNEEVSAARQPPITDKEPKTSSRRNYEAEKRKWSLLLADPDPINRDFAKRQIDEINRQEDLELKKGKQTSQERQFAHQQTQKFAEEIRESANKSREVVDAAKEIKKISKKGVTGAKAPNLIYSALKAKKNPLADIFLSSDLQSLMANTKSLMGGTLSEIVGPRPTASEFFWLENIVPNILKDAATNEAAADYFEKIGNFGVKRAEIFDDIVKENKGFRPIDIETQVRDRMRLETDKLIDQGFRDAPSDLRINILNPDTGEMVNIQANKYHLAKKEGFQIIP